MTRRPEGCRSDLELSLSLVEGELTPLAVRTLEMHLADCLACRERLSRLREERQAFYVRRPRIAAESSQPAIGWRRWVWLSAASLATGVLIFLVGMFWFVEQKAETLSLRFKGAAPGLHVWVERGGVVERGRSPLRLSPGDRIRFATSLSEDAYLTIVNLDEQARLTSYFPAQPGQSQLCPAGVERPLPDSIRLDDTLGSERVFALFSRAPLDFVSIRRALAAMKRPGSDRIDLEQWDTLPVPAFQRSVLIEKVRRDEP